MAEVMENLWMVLGGLCFVETILLLIIWRYAKGVCWTWIKAALVHKNYAITIRGTVDNKFKFDNPEIDGQDPHKWSIFSQGKSLPREIKNGHVRRGPDGVDMVLITDDCTSSLSVDELQNQRIGSTPAYVQQLEDLAYANGFNDGFKKSQAGSIMSDIKENLGSIIVILAILGMGFYVFHDQIISSPGYVTMNKQCQDKMNLIVNKCSPYVNLQGELSTPGVAPPPTTTLPPKSATGAVVK